MWWSGDVRDYWLILTILEMVTILINDFNHTPRQVYCVFVVLMFYRYISSATNHHNGKESYRPRKYDEFKKDICCVNNYLPELEHPIKPGYRKNESSRRDQYNRLQDYTMVQQQSAPTTPTHARKTTFADDLVSTWVKEQQSLSMPLQDKELSDHANSEPITQHKPEDICSLKAGKEFYCRSGSRRRDHSDQDDHNRRRSSSRHRYRFPSLTSTSGSMSTDYAELMTVFADDLYLVGRRSRSFENDSAATDDLGITEGHRSRRMRFENCDVDSKRYCPRKLKRNQYDDKKLEFRFQFPLFGSFYRAIFRATSGNASPTVAVQTDSILSRWSLDPQKGLTLPQQIIIPPSSGIIGPDGRPQPQTYQINSEIRISYDQKGRPIPHEVSALSKQLESVERSPPTYSQPRVSPS
uniref:Velvet domain-containing protein n=1 Tax=Elaeophora elaphi TaxID=1147741 RepID=A0A0R3RFB0_9BILA